MVCCWSGTYGGCDGDLELLCNMLYVSDWDCRKKCKRKSHDLYSIFLWNWIGIQYSPFHDLSRLVHNFPLLLYHPFNFYPNCHLSIPCRHPHVSNLEKSSWESSEKIVIYSSDQRSDSKSDLIEYKGGPDGIRRKGEEGTDEKCDCFLDFQV